MIKYLIEEVYMINKSRVLYTLYILLSLLLIFLIGGCARYGHVVFEDERGTVSVEVSKGSSKGHYESK